MDTVDIVEKRGELLVVQLEHYLTGDINNTSAKNHRLGRLLHYIEPVARIHRLLSGGASESPIAGDLHRASYGIDSRAQSNRSRADARGWQSP